VRTPLLGILAVAIAVPAIAGDIHGKVVCKGTRDSAGAVVYVDAIPGKSFPAPQEHQRINQQNLVFVPHVLPVLVGTTVEFLNSDAVQHNVFSPDACAEKFNLGTWQQGTTKEYTFNKCTKFPCAYTLLCRAHPEMEGNIVVLENSYFAVSDKEGHYTINGVPPGSYSLAVWHQKAKAQPKPVTVAADRAATADFVLSR